MPEQQRKRSGLQIAAKLIGLVRPMLPIMAGAIIMGVIGFLCAIFITIFGAWGLLEVMGQQVPLPLGAIFASLAVFAVLRGVLRYAEQACNHFIAFKLLATIRDKVFTALRRLAPAKLESRQKGDLISMITSDIELLEVFYAHTISPVAIAIIVSIIMVIFMAQLHIAFAIIALLGYVVVGLLLPMLVSRLGRNAGSTYRAESGALSGALLDSLRGLREILQYNQGEKRLADIKNRTEQLGQTQKKMKNYEGLTTALTNTAILVFAFVVLVVGISLYTASSITFYALLTAFVAMIGSFGPVIALANLSNNLLHTFAAADRVLDILEEQPETPDIVNGINVSFNSLACNNVSFGYGSEEILSDYSLTVAPNQIVGIQGKSGSGKSTLLRLLMRFWDVNSGSITISGDDLRQINTASLRENESFVTQDTVLFNDTIENNVKIAKLSATQQEVEDACRKASIHNFITTLPMGYQTNVGELGDSLSGGEKQRIGLARAFLHEAPLILLDEPTSNLDSLNEGIILKAIKEESSGKTIIMVSHRRSTLGIADTITLMSRTTQS